MLKKRFIAVVSVLSLLISLSIASLAADDAGYATRGEVCDMLLSAADDYTEGLTRGDIIKGYENGETKEDQFITRAESFVMISRAFGALPEPVGNDLRISPDPISYTDVPEWAENDVKNLTNARVVIGSDNGKLHENDNVTVEQVKLVIRRIWTLIGTNLRDDFYTAVNKAWLDDSIIDLGEVGNGTFEILGKENVSRILEIITEIMSKEHKSGTKEQKINDFYNNIVDMDARNKAGYDPIKPYLEKIDAIKTMDELSELQDILITDLNYHAFFSFWLSPDLKDSSTHTLNLYSVGSDFTREDIKDENSAKIVAYKKLGADFLKLVSDENPEEKANEYFEFEKKIVENKLEQHEYYNVEKIYNIYTFDELDKLFPAINLKKLSEGMGYKKQTKVMVADKKVLEFFSECYNEKNLPLLKTIMKLDLIGNKSGLLSQEFSDASYEYQKAALGVEGRKAIEEIALNTTQGVMSDYIGEIFVEKYFSAEAKKDVENMITEFIAIFKARIEKLDWMSDVTKQKAIKKLDTMVIKVGYPDKWDGTIDNVSIKPISDGGSYFDDVTAISTAMLAENAALEGKPVDKTKFLSEVYVVNAFYNPQSNDITFPAGILQAPFYDVNALHEKNLGGIGLVIAHEITHAFDKSGAQFDENGNAVDWWTKEDYEKFEELCNNVVKHYDKLELAPGIFTNGTLTLTENIADIGALSCGLDAMEKLENPDYNMFFRQWAETWKGTNTYQYIEYATNIDSHSIDRIRTNSSLNNFPKFYEFYGIKEGDGMYTENPVSIW